MSKANTIRLSVGGMSCAGCVASVEQALQSVSGVQQVSVNFAEHTALVEGDVSNEVLITAVKVAGYDAAILQDQNAEEEKQAAEMIYYHQLLKRAGVAAVVGIPLFISGMSGWIPSQCCRAPP